MKVVNFKILEKTSKKGNVFKALYAILENGQEIFVCFVN